MLSSGVLCPSGRILSLLIEGFFCSLLQVGTSCEAKSQNSDESCQKISPLQRKQRKTTSWWGFPGGGKVKSSLLPSMCCLKMAVLQRENIFFPPSKGVCGVNERACALSTRTQIGLRRGYECYFHGSFEWAESGLERRRKMKSLLYEHRKEMWSGPNSKQGLAGSRPGVESEVGRRKAVPCVSPPKDAGYSCSRWLGSGRHCRLEPKPLGIKSPLGSFSLYSRLV